MNSLIYLLIFLIIGLIAQKLLSTQKQLYLANFLNKLVVYISLPALVIVSMVDLEVNSSFILPALTAWILYFLSAVTVLALGKLLRWSRALIGAMLLVIPYGNTSFLGIPFTKALFGESAIAYAIVYDQLGSFLILSIFGVITLAIFSNQKTSVNKIIFKIATFPSFVALIIALALSSKIIPSWLLEFLELVSKTLIPVALIAIGLFLKLKLPKKELLPFFLALLIKMVFFPLLVLFAFRVFGLNDISAKVTLLESAMAPMITSSMLAIMANLERNLVASILGYAIAFSFISVPLFFKLIQM